MMWRVPLIHTCGALATSLVVMGCRADDVASGPLAPTVDHAEQSIHGPQRAADTYSEGVKVKVNNSFGDFCSGVLVAPSVVLTAAHCVAFNPSGVAPRGTWTITAPFALGGSQVRNVSVNAFETFETNFTTASGGRSNYDSHPELHDLGLLYLDSPFTGVVYPQLSTTRYPIGTSHPLVSAVGRAFTGETAGLVLSQPVALSGSVGSFLNDNTTPVVTDGGDSGGPLFLEGTHTLVGTETRFSGQGASDIDYWARLDSAVYAWIAARVGTHGGFNPTLSQFRDDVSNALCGRVETCCAVTTPGYVLSAPKCHSVYDAFGFEATARGILTAGAFNVVVDGVAKAACLQKIVNNAADCSTTSAEMKGALSDCLATVTGRVALGGSCASSLECGGNAVCERNVAGVGSCQALRTAGQSCEVVHKVGDVYTRDNLAQDLCSKRGAGASGLYCDAYDFGAGAYRAESAWTCKAAVATGGACTADASCSSSVCAPFGEPGAFTCVASTSFVTASVCTAFAP